MKGILQLINGECFQGKWLTNAPIGEVKGELVFYTGMTGYQEVLTDPSYKDKIVVFTYPLIGNYGINEASFNMEKPLAAGVIVYEAKPTAFHYEAKYTLADYLQKWGIPMLGHIDTRAVVRNIRNKDLMTAYITSPDAEQAPAQEVKKVSQATA